MLHVRYISDLHLEHRNAGSYVDLLPLLVPHTHDEILVLAGDIGHPAAPHYRLFLEYINRTFKKTFIIAGNHEYYGSDIMTANAAIRAVLAPLKNITFLDNSAEIYEGVCFIGTTLWTRVTTANMTNDVRCIRGLTCDSYNSLHAQCVAFLEGIMSADVTKGGAPCVVITHHMPSYELTHPMYKTPEYVRFNQWYSANLDDFMSRYCDRIRLWIYGHTHVASVQTVAGIRCICNPIGYPREKTGVDYDATATLIK